MKKKIVLNNSGPVDSIIPDLYFPRLQVTKHGAIILAISKSDTLTSGILVGKRRGCKLELSIGTKIDDWEVCGELVDYDGEVTITIVNKVRGGNNED